MGGPTTTNITGVFSGGLLGGVGNNVGGLLGSTTAQKIPYQKRPNGVEPDDNPAEELPETSTNEKPSALETISAAVLHMGAAAFFRG